MTADEQKQAAAKAALDFIRPGMKVGLGTGSTARHFVNLIGERVRGGFDIQCVPTSEETRKQAEELKIPLTTLEAHPFLDITIDGTDEFDDKFQLIKGGGGALLFEKIVATSSRVMVVIADQSKQVPTLGKFPLPIEVVPFGIKATAWKIEKVLKFCGLEAKLVLRQRNGKTFRSDAGHAIIDASLGAIPEPERLGNLLSLVPGVVDHGLFIGVCGIILMGTDDGVKKFQRA
ncbi:MAG: ribose-5-phosphate isomerase RpiA [Alphaproteobacteria bacterium]|nr:ribose-5-phosphate isomerase RpiA [Alphaproteobacteria bacterium]